MDELKYQIISKIESPFCWC